jgi:membrane protein YdbS with pleckstrin-like domain
MNQITFECPHCKEIITGDESLYGQPVTCQKCHTTILVPPAPAVSVKPQTARLIQRPAAGAPPVPEAPGEETEIFTLSPVARAFPGLILLGVAFLALAVGLALRAPALSWPRWVALVPVALGMLPLLVVWVHVKSSSYRLTTQRLFVRRGWMSRHLNELELYRVKDVVVDQRFLQRLLGYGTVTIIADDDSTPTVSLAGVSGPTQVKEMIRTQYRASRQREGVHPTEFMQSPDNKGALP